MCLKPLGCLQLKTQIVQVPGTPGPDGPPGANGAQWFNGEGAPSAGLGSNGDYYVDTDSTPANIYYKSAGAWAIVTTLPQGPPGGDGDPGEPGVVMGPSLTGNTLSTTGWNPITNAITFLAGGLCAQNGSIAVIEANVFVTCPSTGSGGNSLSAQFRMLFNSVSYTAAAFPIAGLEPFISALPGKTASMLLRVTIRRNAASGAASASVSVEVLGSDGTSLGYICADKTIDFTDDIDFSVEGFNASSTQPGYEYGCKNYNVKKYNPS